MWSVLKQIFRQAEIYTKPLGLYVVVVLVVIAGVGGWHWFNAQPTPQAATQLVGRLAPRADTERADYDVVIDTAAGVTVNGIPTRGAITYEGGRANFLLVLASQTGVYVGEMTATVHLPKASPPAADLEPRVYAVHGVGSANAEVVDTTTARFFARDVLGEATVSIGLSFPDDYFAGSGVGRFESQLGRLPPTAWLALGVTLPAATLLFLLFVVVRTKWRDRSIRAGSPTAKPPLPTPPGMVGALFGGRIGTREIAATLLNLADRGFVEIYHGQSREIAFSRGSKLYSQKTTALRPYEIFLLHQIFDANGAVAASRQIENRLDRELFSSKMALTMVNLYDGLVGEGYYFDSPNRYFARYQAAGMILFFVATAGALYGSFTLPEPAYILFLWLGMMAAALIIVRISVGLPTRTAKGTAALARWLGFRRYLTDRDPVEAVQPSQFFDYLPYAVVLNCVDEWVARWRLETIVLPHWLTTTDSPQSADDYKQALLALIAHLSQNLVAARPPTLA